MCVKCYQIIYKCTVSRFRKAMDYPFVKQKYKFRNKCFHGHKTNLNEKQTLVHGIFVMFPGKIFLDPKIM